MTTAALPVGTGAAAGRSDGEPVVAFVRGHVPVLDGVRGVAVLLLLCHQLVLDVLPDEGAPATARLLERLMQPGWMGVQLFFVLSGFLITGVLLDSKGRAGYFSSFYARRVLRIFPLYYLLLVTLAFVLPLFGPVPPPLRAAAGDMPLAWVYLSNWSENVPGPIGHCWSLAVEEQFYLLWPLVVAMSRPRRLLQICGSLAVAALGFRIGVRAFGLSHEIAYENTLARMDALALGAAASVLVRDPTAVARLMPRLRRALWPALVVLAACWGFGSARTGAVTQLVTYSLLAIVFAVLITLGVTEQARGGGRLSTFLSARPFRVFGKYSYAIYVVHLPLHTYVSHVLLADWFAYRGAGRYVAVQIGYAVVMTGLLLGLAMLSYHLFEKHFLRLKRFFSTAA